MTRPPKGAERSEQILEAMIRCLDRTGLAAMTLNDVANEAGLPRPLVRHFMGNRSDMIDALIAHVVELAEAQFQTFIAGAETPSTEQLIGFLNGGLFSDQGINAVMNELWYLAVRDENIRSKLQRIYARVLDALEKQIIAEGITKNKSQARDLAYTLMSLAYGDASYRGIGVIPTDPKAVLKAALAITGHTSSK